MTKSKDNFLASVAILAGGMGTRLSARSGDLPKSMVPILGKSVLEHQIQLCKKHGFNDIVILTHYKHEQIQRYFGDGSKFGVNIKYSNEQSPRGTAGALYDARNLLSNDFLVLYGDTYIMVDLRHFYNQHINNNNSATLFLHPNDHPQDSDIVEVDNDFNIVKIHPYPHPEDLNTKNLVNAALYVLRNDLNIFKNILMNKSDIAKDLFPLMIKDGLKLKGYVSCEYIKDMGTPNRLDKVEADINLGIPVHLSHSEQKSAVFLDRDGTIIKEVDHLNSIQQLELLENASDAIRLLNTSGFLSLVITNQPVIARGELTISELNKIHNRLEWMLGINKAYLDRIYYCPHHPDKGFIGEVSSLKFDCCCRKPATGLIDLAVKDFNICKSKSWMIGDMTSDIEAGRRAGLSTILVRTGYAGTDRKFVCKPDYIANNLLDAVRWVTGGHYSLRAKLLPVLSDILTRKKRILFVSGHSNSGKTYSAQVLKELLIFCGMQAHIICLDGWLKPLSIRNDGDGVLERYDLNSAKNDLTNLLYSNVRFNFLEPIYDRASRTVLDKKISHSIGPNDFIIIEGVPSLNLMSMLNVDGSTSIYVETNEEIRISRLVSDYQWRGYNHIEIQSIINSRNADEVPVTLSAKANADYTLKF